jgi:hypothetical protein
MNEHRLITGDKFVAALLKLGIAELRDRHDETAYSRWPKTAAY